MEEIKKIDMKEILKNAARDLRSMKHYTSLCVQTGGLEKSQQLKVTTKNEIIKYKKIILNSKSGSVKATDSMPWTKI